MNVNLNLRTEFDVRLDLTVTLTNIISSMKMCLKSVFVKF